MKTGVPLRVVLASLVAIATTLPTLAKAEGPREDDVLPGRVRRLPPLWLIPADASSRRVADEMARALALVGLYEPVIGQPGEVVPGPSVGVKASQSTKSGATIVDTSVEEEKDGHPARRRVEINPSKQAMDLARLTDGVLLDVSGERSHLSGRISFTYDAAPGHSLRCQALATGQAESTPSPLEKLSPGSFVGPSDRPAITSVRVGRQHRRVKNSSRPILLQTRQTFLHRLLCPRDGASSIRPRATEATKGDSCTRPPTDGSGCPISMVPPCRWCGGRIPSVARMDERFSSRAVDHKVGSTSWVLAVVPPRSSGMRR